MLKDLFKEVEHQLHDESKKVLFAEIAVFLGVVTHSQTRMETPLPHQQHSS